METLHSLLNTSLAFKHGKNETSKMKLLNPHLELTWILMFGPRAQNASFRPFLAKQYF